MRAVALVGSTWPTSAGIENLPHACDVIQQWRRGWFAPPERVPVVYLAQQQTITVVP